MPITTNTRTTKESRTTRTYLEKGNATSHPSKGRTTRTCLQRQGKGKGKAKLVDVTTIASSSTSTTSTPPELKTKWRVRPKVATQEPTEGKTNPQSTKPQDPKAKTEPQEPTFAKEVEPQEPVLLHGGAKNEEHYEADILKDTKTMLKDFAHTVFATTSQVQIPQSVTMSAKRYATWVFNALP